LRDHFHNPVHRRTVPLPSPPTLLADAAVFPRQDPADTAAAKSLLLSRIHVHRPGHDCNARNDNVGGRGARQTATHAALVGSPGGQTQQLLAAWTAGTTWTNTANGTAASCACGGAKTQQRMDTEVGRSLDSGGNSATGAVSPPDCFQQRALASARVNLFSWLPCARTTVGLSPTGCTRWKTPAMPLPGGGPAE